MKKTHTRQLLVLAALVNLSLAAGMGPGQIEPSGRGAGLVRFDAISELRMSDESAYCVVFARYWVCRDFYAISVVWTEPLGGGITLKTKVILSDENGFRIEDPWRPDSVPVNTTYVRPLGEKGPYRGMGVPYEFQDIRFTEAQALSRRIYASDLAPLNEAGGQGERVVNLKVSAGATGHKRNVAELTVQSQGRRLESMELFDAQRRSLGKMNYRYETDSGAPRLARLVADLPARPVTLKSDTDDREIDYVSHKGGRTCAVTYEDVTIGNRMLRLPTRIEVRVTADQQLLRSARLLNFQGVDLDKEGVWEAARAFSRLDDEFPAWARLVGKYLDYQPKLGPLPIDPNDLTFARQLIARYPVPEVTPGPLPKPLTEVVPGPRELSPEARVRQMRARSEAFRQASMEHARQMRMRPRPTRVNIEPNDARLIRQLRVHYDRVLHPPLTEEEREQFRQQGWYERRGKIPEDQLEIADLHRMLGRVLAYHHAPVLPEDRPPELDPNDLAPGRRLRDHYEKLALQTDRGLGGQLRALHALIRLDLILRDYEAFEAHTQRYLRTLDENGLPVMVMVGGCRHIKTLVEADQYAQASRLGRQWADKAATSNEPEAVFHFVRATFGGKSSPWLSVQLLDRFVQRSGLSPVQRYEALALRAITLDEIDKLLGNLNTLESEPRRAQGQWVLSATDRAALAGRIGPALRQAVQAWQSLGSVGRSQARPYSTASAIPTQLNITGVTEATALQETSALLDQIVQERTGRGGINRTR